MALLAILEFGLGFGLSRFGAFKALLGIYSFTK
jgi:hypothetical protein